MNDFSRIRLEHDGALAWISLNRPDRLNALNTPLMRELNTALDLLAADDSVRVIILRGEGRAFSSGYDIERDEQAVGEGPREQAQETEKVRDITDDHAFLVDNVDHFLRIWDHPKPVIAAVHGYCLAGATCLCVFCDITVVAEDARIGYPALPMGGGFISPMWMPLVGPKRAKQMSFVPGSQISGTTAAEWGWANYAVPADELWDNVRELSRSIAKVPSSTLRMKKRSVNRAAEIQGFRTIVPLGAETDALLHYSGAVREIHEQIHQDGLKRVIAAYRANVS